MDEATYQAKIDADPTLQAALRQFQTDSQQWQTSNRANPHPAKIAADDPAFHAILTNYGNAAKQSPLWQELQQQGYQVGPSGKLEKDPLISPQMLALMVGGGLFTAGMSGVGGASAATGSGSSAPSAPVLEGLAAGDAGSTAVPAGAALGPTTSESMAATTAALAPPASIAAPAAASSVPAWVAPAVKGAVPFAVQELMKGQQQAGANGLNGTGLPPEILAQLQQLIQMSMQRQQETQPVHQAAMLLAQKLGANQNSLPSLNGARADTQGPGPAAPMNPNVSAALARLMGR